MPAYIAAELREIGARIETQRTAEIYAALHRALSDGITIDRDRGYGPHERHRLDVFAPGYLAAKPQGQKAPVLVFVHGGGFSRGQKSAPGSPFYDNIVAWAAANGMVGININYRLAPEHQWPSGIEDLRRVHEWIDGHIAGYGGDPAAVFFWGHSAGAAHVGDYIAARVRRSEPVGLDGAILTSGFYDLGDQVSAWQAYYGGDVGTYASRSALPALIAADLPLLVNDAELDPPSFGPESRKLVDGRRAAGRPVQYLHLLDHSHISETYAVGTADRSLSDPVLEFIRRCL